MIRATAWRWHRLALAALLALALYGGGTALAQARRPAQPPQPVDLSIMLGDLEVERPPGQEPIVIIPTPDGTLRLTATQFLEAIDDKKAEQRERGWLFVFMNISSPIGMAWIALGLAGQVLFAGRMVVQWIVSEKHHRSVVPLSFWWMSLGGATMLIVYFIWRRDAVGVLGQATGWFIYIRNLWMIYTAPLGARNTEPLPAKEDVSEAV